MDEKEFYLSLSDEVKEKIKACKNEQEALDVLEEYAIPLPVELMDKVSGGGLKIFPIYGDDDDDYDGTLGLRIPGRLQRGRDHC